MGIPKLVVLLVLPLYSFLIISCFISNKEIFYLHDTLVPTKWLVLHTKDIIVSTMMQTLVIIGKPFKKQICTVEHSFYVVLLWEKF